MFVGSIPSTGTILLLHSVIAAQESLKLFVWVRIPVKQPFQNADVRNLAKRPSSNLGELFVSSILTIRTNLHIQSVYA